ncbi:unnamed protein product [Euphydryas editha]|uniref:Uncharacterized protein n=1 Tax=Euphydryas editha TaxID=104508 RepID=A0AAU9THH0_EUPED|nr:unnamed protein product [Euphydryas editha]
MAGLRADRATARGAGLAASVDKPTFLLACYKYSTNASTASNALTALSFLDRRYPPRYSLGSILTVRFRTPPEKCRQGSRGHSRFCLIHPSLHIRTKWKKITISLSRRAASVRSAGVTVCTNTTRFDRITMTAAANAVVVTRGEIVENRNQVARELNKTTRVTRRRRLTGRAATRLASLPHAHSRTLAAAAGRRGASPPARLAATRCYTESRLTERIY